MKYNSKAIYSVFVVALLVVSIGQVVPAWSMTSLEKRNYNGDQHLTARYGNTIVCGDHICAPGEWTKLQENLNKAQMGKTGEQNSTSASDHPINSIPAPIPTPPVVPYSICTEVKTTLANSTASSDVVSKVMKILGCI